MRIVIWILALWVAGLGGYLLYEEYWPGATGNLIVLADQPGAKVWLDLRPTGRPADGTPLPVTRGKHSVMVKQEGWKTDPFVQVVDIRPGRTDSLRFSLRKIEEITDSTATVPGEVVPEGTDAGQVRAVPPELPSIKERVRKEMPWDVSRTAPRSANSIAGTIDEDGVVRGVDSLAAIRPDTTIRRPRPDKIVGSVEIASSVPGAEIYVSDRPVEQSTPATIALEAGTYTIRAEKEGYNSSPEEHVVRISRAASAQFIFFTLIEERKARREFTVITEPVAGEIYVDSVLAGTGKAVIPHEFGVFQIQFGEVEGYMSPEPVRLTVTPSNPTPEVKGIYLEDLEFSVYCAAEDQVVTEGDISYEVGIYHKGEAPRVTTTYGPRVRRIPGSQKFGWELSMGDPNRNPTGGDYVEFIFQLPDNVSPALPLNLKIYLYRSNRKYPLSLSNRSEVSVIVNGRIFLDNYRPRHGQEDIEMDRYEEWSLQHSLVPGENRIMIRSGQNNQIFNYLWKIEIN